MTQLISKRAFDAILTVLSLMILLFLYKGMSGACSRKQAALPHMTSNLSQLLTVVHAVNRSAALDIILLSATYYKTSKSLGSNAIVLLFNANATFLDIERHFVLTAWDIENRSIIRSIRPEKLSFNPMTAMKEPLCGSVAYTARGHLLPNTTTLALSTGSANLMIPFRHAETRKRPFVSCVSPIFAFEQWQMLLFHLQVYEHYGAFTVLYIRSIIQSVYDFLRSYHDSKNLDIRVWPRLKLGHISEEELNLNLHVRLRNQDAAHTDCLLLYREAAEFIMFIDPDDILIPRLRPTYHEEFTYLFSMQKERGQLLYRKQNSAIDAYSRPSDFDLKRMLSSIESHDFGNGKYVVKPELIYSTWIHRPFGVLQPHRRFEVPSKWNSIIHLKTIRVLDKVLENATETPLKFNSLPGSSVNTFYTLGESRQRRLNNDEVYARSFNNLYNPQPVYFKMILECYTNDLYSLRDNRSITWENMPHCPAFPERCKKDKNVKVACTNAKSTIDFKLGDVYNIHIMLQDGFQNDDECLF